MSIKIICFFPVVRAVGTPGTTSGTEVRTEIVTVMEREAEKCGAVSKCLASEVQTVQLRLQTQKIAKSK